MFRSPPIRRPFLRPSVKEEITGWLFVLPWLLGFLLFTAGPMIYSLYTGFTKFNIIKPPEWIGLENYKALFFDDPFF
jgi:multiple sugar transport system permease protein